MGLRRIEREWVPVKLYLPTRLYAQLLAMVEQDAFYHDWIRRLKDGSSETEMNATIRLLLSQWFEHQSQIELLSGAKEHRERERQAAESLSAHMERKDEQP